MNIRAFLVWLLVLFFLSVSAQNVGQDSLRLIEQDTAVVQKNSRKQRRNVDPLSPSRAAFYSAILPGLGQAYNGKYWKIPIVVGGLVTGILIYDFNAGEYNRFRDAYKSRLAGFNTDEFWGIDAEGNPLPAPQISSDALIRAQKSARRNRDLSMLVTVGIYALNIIDANVDAHLLQYNVDDNLSLRPNVQMNQLDNKVNYGLSLNFNF